MAAPHAVSCCGDILSLTTSVGVFMGFIVGLLPTFAIVLAIIWYAIEIAESEPGKRFLNRVRRKK